MADSDSRMTIDDLAEIYRVEKRSKSLTPVRLDFYTAASILLKAQRAEYDDELSKDPDSIRCEGANSRRKRGKQLSREIIEMRMDKICKMALRGAMGADNVLDSLTSEEKDYYDAILKASKDHKSVLSRLSGSMTYSTGDILAPMPSATAAAKKQEPTPQEISAEPDQYEGETAMDVTPEDGVFGFDDPDMNVPDAEEQIPDDELDTMLPNAGPPAVTQEAQDMVLVRILEDIPRFAGPMREYSLRKEDVVRLPAEFATVLLNRNLAQKVSASP